MRALVVLLGDVVVPDQKYDLVCCCDGAYRKMQGRRVDLVVGDFDTLGDAPTDVEVVTVPSRKDFTDGELAVREVCRRGATSIDIVGATGGSRPEHVYTNLFLLPIARRLGVSAKIVYEGGEMMLGEGKVELDFEGVKTLSLAPVYGSVHILSSKGLGYPIKDLTLTPDTTIGVSNYPIASKGELVVSEGRVLILISR